ncbi:unnamed protein product [Ilex paraguariensis]|uniref:Uncharacterized protein n=1 Tax=Ilex paraguariensis TaxID=185542 RepID=A0ABC8S877_9AQUA
MRADQWLRGVRSRIARLFVLRRVDGESPEKTDETEEAEVSSIKHKQQMAAASSKSAYKAHLLKTLSQLGDDGDDNDVTFNYVQSKEHDCFEISLNVKSEG